MFRAPGLDTPLGPSVQYWVLGPTPGLIGRFDLAEDRWWAGVRDEYLLARPDQHIAGRAEEPARRTSKPHAGLGT